ncbi:MAG: NIPSNAP family protein [Ramlibacter sp.]
MLIDMRIDTFPPGLLPVFLQRFEKEGLPIQLRHCGNLVGYYTTETGVLNQTVQLWSYRDAADRDTRRAALEADPQWRSFCEFALPLIQHRENRILKPTAFSTIKETTT